MEITKITTHIACAHNADTHVNGADLTTLGECPQQIRLRKDFKWRMYLIQAYLRQAFTVTRESISKRGAWTESSIIHTSLHEAAGVEDNT
jgi:hypothetical protein